MSEPAIHDHPMSPYGQKLFDAFAPKPIEQIRAELIECFMAPWRIGICRACEEDKTTPGGNRCSRCEMQNLTKEDWTDE